LTYISQKKLGREELGPYLAAYLLDRRFHRSFLTEDAVDLALREIIQLARKSKTSQVIIETALISEFNYYLQKRGCYRMNPDQQKTAFNYWLEEEEDSPLKTVALRLASLRSSSANIERTFSKLKFIQSLPKTNLSIETMRDIARIRMNRRPSSSLDSDLMDQESIPDQVSDIVDLSWNDPPTLSTQSTSSFLSDICTQPVESTSELLRNFNSIINFDMQEDESTPDSPTREPDVFENEDIERLVAFSRLNRAA